MKFKVHAVGGAMAGMLTIVTAQVSGYTSASYRHLIDFLNAPHMTQGDIPVLIGLFAVTVFMSLFPDLDSASILQRWFYRFALVILILLFMVGQMGLFAAVSFIILLPLLHKHRGWTHSKITPVLLALFFAVVLELHRSTQAWFGGFSMENVGAILNEYWIYVVACVLGHYTHLLLDWKL